MRVLKFLISPPVQPPVHKWFWQMLTFRLIRQADRRVFWRVFLYLGFFLVSAFGVLTAASPAGPLIENVLSGMAATAVQVLMAALLLDTIERRRLINEWVCAERKAFVDQYEKREEERIRNMVLAAREAMTAHGLAVNKCLEMNQRRREGDGWQS